LSVAALIIAEIDDGASDGTIVSLLPVAGQSLIEYQLRSAHVAGAQHILLYAERLPASLLAMLDSLARDSIKVDFVRTAAEARDHIHPEEHVLIIRAGVVAETAFLRELVQLDGQRLIVVPDTAAHEHFERIDAACRWSGLALLSGTLVRETIAGLGDWELGSTLLRQAVQNGVAKERIDLTAEDAPLLADIADHHMAAAYDKALVRRGNANFGGSVERFIWNPAATLMLPLFLRYSVDPTWFSAILGLCSLLTLASAFMNEPILALCLFIISGFSVICAQRLRGVCLHDAGRLGWLTQLRIVIGGMALIIIIKQLVDYGFGWGYLLLSIWTLVEMFRLSFIDPWFAGKQGQPFWRATPDTMAVILLIAFEFKYPLIGLEVITGYALISGFILTRPQHS
jgi:hypothetical protein